MKLILVYFVLKVGGHWDHTRLSCRMKEIIYIEISTCKQKAPRKRQHIYFPFIWTVSSFMLIIHIDLCLLLKSHGGQPTYFLHHVWLNFTLLNYNNQKSSYWPCFENLKSCKLFILSQLEQQDSVDWISSGLDMSREI